MHETHVIGWRSDESVAGAHNSAPVYCHDYIAALERLVASGTADSTDLDRLQRTFGILPQDQMSA